MARGGHEGACYGGQHEVSSGRLDMGCREHTLVGELVDAHEMALLGHPAEKAILQAEGGKG